MSSRRHVLLASAGALAASFVLRRALAQSPEVTLNLSHFLGPKAPAQTNMLEPWAQNIEKNSAGRVKIEINPGGSPQQLFGQVRDGIADIVWTANAYTAGLFPRSEVFELPTVYTNNIAAANLAMRELFATHLAEEYRDVHVLFMHVHAGQGIHMTDTPAHKPQDLRGKKLRVPGPTGIAVIEQLGATPVPMPLSDLPQALATRAVDGALIPWEIIPALKLQDSTKYQIEGPPRSKATGSRFPWTAQRGTMTSRAHSSGRTAGGSEPRFSSSR